MTSIALIWSQAGGSLKADSAGVWWGSMSFDKRFQQRAFIENQNEIEKDWDKVFRDRKNEIVIIGIELDKEKISKKLNHCLLTDQEINSINWKEGFEDNWLVERSFPLD